MKFDLRDEYKLKEYMPNMKDIKNMSACFFAFSDDTRLKIIILLTMRSLCVNDITKVLSVHQSTVSHQLKLLKSLNIVECDRNGKNIIYYIKNKNVENILNAVVEYI